MDIMLMGWVKQFVAKAIAGAGGGVAPVVVSALPATGDPSKLYLLTKHIKIAEDVITYNYYDEYLWINGKYEQIGSTEIPLDEFITVDEMNAAIAAAMSEPSGPYAFFKSQMALEILSELTLGDFGITVTDGKFSSFPLGFSILSGFAEGRLQCFSLASIGISGELIYEDLHNNERLTFAVDGTKVKSYQAGVESWEFTLEDGTKITKKIKVIS